jgi:hypothetical protein
MKAMGQGGNIAGREDVDRQTDPPTVKARAVNFPVLIHELIKGTLELVALHGRNRDEEGNEEDFTDIEESEDTLEKEMWDLRLGPAIWDRIRSKFPEDVLTDETKGVIQLIVFQHIFKKPAKEFLVFMKEVVSNSETGNRLMETLVRGIEEDINNYDYEQTMAEFDDELTDVTDQTDNDELKDFILGIPGVSLSNDNDEEDDDVRKEVVDRKYYEGLMDNEIPVKLYLRYLRVPGGKKQLYDGLYKLGDNRRYVRVDISRDKKGIWIIEDEKSVGVMELMLEGNKYKGSWVNADGNGFDVELAEAGTPPGKIEALDGILDRGMSGKLDETKFDEAVKKIKSKEAKAKGEKSESDNNEPKTEKDNNKTSDKPIKQKRIRSSDNWD